MTAKFKIVGLASVAALAMSMAMATAAQALNFTAASYPVSVSGESTAENTHVITYAGREITCKKVTFAAVGTQGGPTNSIDLAPSYEECHAIVLGNKLPATVTTNGCVFEVTLGTTLSANQMHIDCWPFVSAKIHIYSDAGHTTKVCEYSIGDQTVGDLTYTNMASDITISTNSLESTVRLFGSLLVCGAASGNALYQSTASTLSGKNGSGEAVAIDAG